MKRCILGFCLACFICQFSFAAHKYTSPTIFIGKCIRAILGATPEGMGGKALGILPGIERFQTYGNSWILSNLAAFEYSVSAATNSNRVEFSHDAIIIQNLFERALNFRQGFGPKGKMSEADLKSWFFSYNHGAHAPIRFMELINKYGLRSPKKKIDFESLESVDVLFKKIVALEAEFPNYDHAKGDFLFEDRLKKIFEEHFGAEVDSYLDEDPSKMQVPPIFLIMADTSHFREDLHRMDNRNLFEQALNTGVTRAEAAGQVVLFSGIPWPVSTVRKFDYAAQAIQNNTPVSVQVHWREGEFDHQSGVYKARKGGNPATRYESSRDDGRPVIEDHKQQEGLWLTVIGVQKNAVGTCVGVILQGTNGTVAGDNGLIYMDAESFNRRVDLMSSYVIRTNATPAN
jgi:hypothetical protein